MYIALQEGRLVIQTGGTYTKRRRKRVNIMPLKPRSADRVLQRYIQGDQYDPTNSDESLMHSVNLWCAESWELSCPFMGFWTPSNNSNRTRQIDQARFAIGTWKTRMAYFHVEQVYSRPVHGMDADRQVGMKIHRASCPKRATRWAHPEAE